MALVVEYHEELELDLLPDFDLLDFWRGSLSPRRLELLIRDLPATSRLKRALAPEVAAVEDWSVTDYLIASLWDLQVALKWTDRHAKAPTFPRPADRLQMQRRWDALDAQAERNRLREEASNG